MNTSLYVPYEGFNVNGKPAESLLFKELIRTGPSYSLVVHETDEWLRIKDVYEHLDRIEIIPNKKWNQFTELSELFFNPLIEDIKYFEQGRTMYQGKQLTADLSRALFLIMIGNHYGARIYDSNMLEDALDQISHLEVNKSVLNQDEIYRLNHFAELIRSYKQDSVHGLWMTENYPINKEFNKIFSNEKIEFLSTQHHRLGILGEKFNVLKREILESVTEIVQSKYFPWISDTTYTLIGIGLDEQLGTDIFKFLGPTLRLLSKEVQGLDLRTYAPPVVPERFLGIEGVFMSQPVNSKIYLAIPKR